MKYLLDTCVVSDFVKGEKNTLDKLKKVSPNEIAISSITVMEIQYGITLNPKYGKIIEPVILDLETIKVVGPGKYELDLVHLFKGEPLIFKLEDGKYMIDLVESFKALGRKKLKR